MTKPKLVLLKGKGITPEGVAAMYQRITGKKCTPEQIEEGRRILDSKR